MPDDYDNWNEQMDLPIIYVDAFRIGFDAYKFVLDLGAIPQDAETPKFTTRMIMGPDIAMEFVEILRQSFKEYKGRFGQINTL
ncbi:MAG: hypothetical protein NPIRA05_05830 [Nitrospirales bacterium]|nr:MAG: hypothetical protein NPIRA05_05830 [Nitrospirales bacterium]